MARIGRNPAETFFNREDVEMRPELGAKVISIAKGLVGSHYINGGYGARPNRSDGCPCRPGGITLVADGKRLDPAKVAPPEKNLAVFAAEMNIKKYCVCAGNYATYPGGREASPTDGDLIAYLDTLKGSSPGTWHNYYIHFTPRRAFGPGPGGDLGGKLIWGQSCKDIRHFDCVGFISYCYWQATGKVVQLEISAWRAVPNPMGATVFDLKAGKRPSSLSDADILVQADHHIGFVSSDGVVIEAQDTHLGVRASAGFSLAGPGKWTHLVRLPDPAAVAVPIPDWLPGWWKVTWRNEAYYYFFDHNFKVKWTPNPPAGSSPPTSARDAGNVKLLGSAEITIHWNATGTIENLGLLPSIAGGLQMGGTWNGREPLEAEKL
jgi:hypothetical protein